MEMSELDSLLTTCTLGTQREVDDLLLRNPDVLGMLTNDDKQLLVEAARSGSTSAVENLLKLGIDINLRGLCGGTALHWASWHGQLETVQCLLERGADVELKCTSYKNTPLSWAVFASTKHRQADGDYPAVVRALLERGAEIFPFNLEEGDEAVVAILKDFSK